MNPETVLKKADCLYTNEQVQSALREMAQSITRDMADSNPLVLCVMSGALIPAGHLLTMLNFPLQLDYIHATRYRGETKGGTLHWLKKPEFSLRNRTVLLIDDIYDEGVTLSELIKFCESQEADRVYTAVLVNKLHDRKCKVNIDYIGLETDDRYLFGYGMDYNDYLRNAPGIYAIPDEE